MGLGSAPLCGQGDGIGEPSRVGYGILMSMNRACLTLVGALSVCVALAQSGDYPVFETDKIPPAEFRERRQKLMESMGPGSIGVFFTNPEQVRNDDVDFQFRGDSDFLCLTGFEEPDGEGIAWEVRTSPGVGGPWSVVVATSRTDFLHEGAGAGVHRISLIVAKRGSRRGEPENEAALCG